MRLISTIAVFSLLLLTSCQVGIPTVSGISDARMVTGKKGGIGVEVDVKINNPNAFIITLKKIKLDLYMDDSMVGTAKNTKKVQIIPNSNETYTISLGTDAKQLTGLGFGLLNGTLGSKSNFRVKGFGVARVGLCSKRFDIDESTRMGFR